MDECVFCRIASGELPSKVVHQDGEFLAFEDVQPRAEHHILVIPRTHHENLDGFVTGGGSGERMLRFVGATARSRGLAGRYRLVTNVGEDAGQVVPHLHWHVMAGDGLPGF